MNNFNLLVSTSRFNEVNAKAEMWFSLLICGDIYPIISGIKYPGLITAATNIHCKEVIKRIKNILEKDSNFFQFILKIIPIDYVCETSLSVIKNFVDNYYRKHLSKDQSFRIDLKRRKSETIERDSFIDSIARVIDNKVNLDTPDKILRLEIIGNVTGISFLNPDDIILVKNVQKKI